MRLHSCEIEAKLIVEFGMFAMRLANLPNLKITLPSPNTCDGFEVSMLLNNSVCRVGHGGGFSNECWSLKRFSKHYIA